MSTAPVVLPVAATTTTAPVRMSFIKRLGSMFRHGVEKAIAVVEKDAKPIENIALVVGTIAGVGPQVQLAEDTFNLMFGEVVHVEQIATAVGKSEGTGLQKLDAAIPQVESIILANPLFKGKTITDLTKWNNAIASITGSLYDLGNSVDVPVAAGVGTAAAVAPVAS